MAKRKEAVQVDWWAFEHEMMDGGFASVCGVDEAGRGPLAGPVYAAAVILPKDCIIEGLNDSKKLTEAKREKLYDIIKEKAVAYGIASASVAEIEELNILKATFLAMRRAVAELEPMADAALIDGNRLPELDIPARAVVKGDALSASIAAASVLAKVTRDRYMMTMHELYPEYAFDQHKGYGTALHCDRIRELGPSPIHRPSFLKKILNK
jgi:ribonuclease HII